MQETDLTNVIPAVSTAIGGYVGTFEWGPVNEVVLVSSEKELSSIFGIPTATTTRSFHTAASFLKYTSALKVSRAVTSLALNATSGASGLLVKNDDHFATLTPSGDVSFIARHPGTWGNRIKVQVASASTWSTGGATFADATFKAQFDYAPSKTNSGGYSDEIHILITNAVTGEILEKWTGLSMAPDAKSSSGSSLYYKNVLNASSAYVYAVRLGGVTITANDGLSIYNSSGGFNTAGDVSADDFIAYTLTNGTLGSGTPLYSDAAEVFTDAAIVDVSLLFGEAVGTGSLDPLESKLLEIAERRKDAVVFVSAPLTVATAGSAATKLSLAITKGGLINSSYAFIDSTPVYVYDKYSDTYLWIPACGHIAGLCARTDATNDPWWSPAGYNRGNLLGVTKLAFNPTDSERDELYKVGVNPIVSFPGQGTLLYGDKTAQKKPSAFDRINVRRLFIVLEKAISTAAKYQLFEFNDEFTRAMFRNMVEPFLRDVKGRRGITDFLVVCDETNNTGEVIDTNRFVGEIYIKPARSINFINLNFIATRTGVSFSEIAGSSSN